MTNQEKPYDKILFILQGGGALGSYQVGVCQGLMESRIHPDWVVGTSIGAINGAIIAGNLPENRIKKLQQFWDAISTPFPLFPIQTDNYYFLEWMNFWSAALISLFGVPGFFKPRLVHPWIFSYTTPDNISYYDISDLQKTLLEVIDFDLINQKKTRLTLGAVEVRTGKMIHFDNYKHTITPEHVMASGALPPGFPAIKIGEEYYWDGGISSNTPFSVVLEEKIPEKLLCFVVNLYSYWEHIPKTMIGVMKSKKEIIYSSRHHEILKYFCELHYLQSTIQSLAPLLSNNDAVNQALKKIKRTGHPKALDIVQFHYLDRPSDLASKDFNFARMVLEEHYQSGYADVQNAIKDPKWLDFNIHDSGAEIHEF